PWLVQHHDEIRVMRPRLLAINYSDSDDTTMLSDMQVVIRAIREGSKYHGYNDPAHTPAFLEYDIAYVVNLQGQMPCDPQNHPFHYGKLFSPEYAAAYNVRDAAGNLLDLCQLVDAGLVHELWFYGSQPSGCTVDESDEYKVNYDYDGNRHNLCRD